MLKHTIARLGLATVAALLLGGGAAQAATFAVDRTDDNPQEALDNEARCTAAADDCTLRDAVIASNAADTTLNTVTLPAQTLNVTARLPSITNGVTIVGSNARSSTIDGGNRDFELLLGDEVNTEPLVLRNLTVRHMGSAKTRSIVVETVGNAKEGEPAPNTPALELDRVAIVDSFTSGVVVGAGTAVVHNSLIARNHATLGAIFNLGGRLSISNTTIARNVPAPVAVPEQEIAPGGGVLSLCDTTITSSTIANNESNSDSPFLGGLEAGANLAALDPPNAMGLPCDKREMTVSSSIVVGDSAHSDCTGEIKDTGHNVASDFNDSCAFLSATDRVPVNPGVGPLRNNGGPTDTLAVLAGSPAIDAGAGCGSLDQRGVKRPQGRGCDSGAFESGFSTAPIPVTRPDVTAPRLTLKGIAKRVSRRAFNAGLKLRVGANEPVVAEVTLLVAPAKARIAKARPLTLLASRSLRRAAGTRTVRLKPVRKLAGRRRVKAQVRVVAFDAAGNRSAKTISFTVR